MNSRGFTVVELVVVIVVIGILIPMTMFAMNGLSTNAKDRERASDMEAVAQQLELVYTNKLVDNAPNYPGTNALSSTDKTALFSGGTLGVTEAPDTNTFSIISAAPNSSIGPSAINPRPTATTYVYQPLTIDNNACTAKCAKFNLYYLKVSDNSVLMIKSKRQQ